MVDNDKVKVVMISTGEVFFAELTMTSTGNYNFKRPTVLFAQEMEDGQMGIACKPWTPYTEEDEVTLKENQVVYAEKPLNQLVEVYAAYHNKIITPPKKGLIY